MARHSLSKCSGATNGTHWNFRILKCTVSPDSINNREEALRVRILGLERSVAETAAISLLERTVISKLFKHSKEYVENVSVQEK